MLSLNYNLTVLVPVLVFFPGTIFVTQLLALLDEKSKQIGEGAHDNTLPVLARGCYRNTELFLNYFVNN